MCVKLIGKMFFALFPESECYRVNGRDYNGSQSYLEGPQAKGSNITECLYWNDVTGSQFNNLPENYCRFLLLFKLLYIDLAIFDSDRSRSVCCAHLFIII